MRYLSHFSKICSPINNSARSNTGITTKITYYNQLQIYENIFYHISSSVWPYGDIERIRRGWSTKCTYDMHKRCYVCIILLYKWSGGDWMSIIKVLEDGQSSYIPTRRVLDCNILVWYTRQHMHRKCIRIIPQHTPNQFMLQ